MKQQSIVKSSIIILGIFSLSTVAEARSAKPLADPAPVEWGCKLSAEKVKQGINMGLIGRGWTPSELDNGQIQGRIVVRGKHTLVVNILYTESSFDVDYSSSNNLKYTVSPEGVKKIHPNANSWMKNLNDDIKLHLNTLCK